jgi:hypothetical protein
MHGICAYPRAEACRRVAHIVPWRAAVKEQFGRPPVGPAKAPSTRFAKLATVNSDTPRLVSARKTQCLYLKTMSARSYGAMEKLRPSVFGQGFQLERVLFNSWRTRGSDSSLQSFGTWFTEREAWSSRSREGRVLFSPAQGDA